MGYCLRAYRIVRHRSIFIAKHAAQLPFPCVKISTVFFPLFLLFLFFSVNCSAMDGNPVSLVQIRGYPEIAIGTDNFSHRNPRYSLSLSIFTLLPARSSILRSFFSIFFFFYLFPLSLSLFFFGNI
mgnify:CR=1 FL=1